MYSLCTGSAKRLIFFLKKETVFTKSANAAQKCSLNGVIVAKSQTMQKHNPNIIRAFPVILQVWARLKDRKHSGQQLCKWPWKRTVWQSLFISSIFREMGLLNISCKDHCTKELKIQSCYQFPLHVFGTLMFPN